MRVMMLMIPEGYETAAVEAMPTAAEVAEMERFNTRMIDAGVMLTGEGLFPPAAGIRILHRGGPPQVVRGPFPDTREALGGYWILKVDSMDEALTWALQCPGDTGYTLELRRIQELEDFPPDVQAVVMQHD
jgi:hypothetical protein